MKQSRKSRNNCFLYNIKSEIKKHGRTERIIDPIHILNEISDNKLSFIGRNVCSSFQNALKNLKVLSNIKDLDMDNFEWPLENAFRDKMAKFIKIFNFCDELKKLFDQETLKTIARKRKKGKHKSINTHVLKHTLNYEKLLETKKHLNKLNSMIESKLSQNPSKQFFKNQVAKAKNITKAEDNLDFEMLPAVEAIDSDFSLTSLKKSASKQAIIIKHNEESSYLKNEDYDMFTCLQNQLPIYGHTSEALSTKCKDLLRDIGNNEKLKNYLISLGIKRKIDLIFIKELEKLLETTKNTFQLNAVENYAKDMYIMFSTNRKQNYLKIIALLLKIKKKSITDNANIKNENETKIRNLKLEAITHKELVAENFKTIKGDTHEDEIMEKYNHKLEVINQVLASELSILDEKVEHAWNSEAKLRVAKKLLFEKIAMLEKKIDDTFNEHKEKKMHLRNETNKTKDMIAVLEKNYYPLEKKFEEVMEQRRRQREHLESDKLIAERRLAAALKIQNWWRAYKMRKRRVYGYKSMLGQ